MATRYTLADGSLLVASEIVGGESYKRGHRWAAFIGHWGSSEAYYGPDEETVLKAARAMHQVKVDK